MEIVVKLRELKSDDYPQWLDLWNGYQKFYKVSIAQSVTEITFKRLLDKDEPIYCLVFENNNKIFGFVHYIFHRSTWTEGNYCYLQDLFVDTNQRTSEIGGKLIQAVYEKAEQEQCSRVYWLTHETNYQARILYDRMADNAGFIQYRKDI